MYTTRYAERKPGLDNSQGCWCCIILYYPLISTYNQKVKKGFQTIKDGPVSQTSFSNWFLGNLTPPMASLSLSLFLCLPLSPFQAEFPSGAWRLSESTYLPWLLRSMPEGAQGGAPSAIQVGTSGLTVDGTSSFSGTLLAFCVNQVIQPLFSTEFSYYTILS